MFDWLKKKSNQDQSEIRDTLFGDLPYANWPVESPAKSYDEPWLSFIQAKQQASTGNKTQAIHILQGILSMPDLESRHYLQAWHFLRALDIQPLDDAKHVLGVIVEVAMPQGLDIVAAYEDHTARYFNYSGAAIIWEQPDKSLDQHIDALLSNGQSVADQIGPWEISRPPSPPKNDVRISMLTPSGLHFGQGALNVLSNDAMGGPVIALATVLMQQLIAKGNVS